MSVLSIGVIGIAGMQLAAHRSNQQSAYATHAVQLAQDMAERIRANAGASDARYQIDTRHLPDAPGKKCYGGISCTPDEMALLDVHEWAHRVAARNTSGNSVSEGLPGGRGIVCRDSQPWKNSDGYGWACKADAGAPLVVKVGWLGKHADGSLAGQGKGGSKERPHIVLFIKP